MTRHVLVLAALVVPSVTSCTGTSDDNDTTTPTDTSDPLECIEDATCGDFEICEENECVMGDRDDTFEGANSVFQVQNADDPNVSVGLIHTAGDVDHFVYQAAGPEWLRVWTQTNETDEDGLDTVVSVYGANGALHHYMDETGTGSLSSYDTLMHVYLPSAGTWYFRVEDKSTFEADGEPRGDSAWRYRFGVQAWGSVTVEPDSLEDPSIVFELATGTTIYPWGVLIEEPGDVDYTTAAMPYGDAPFEIWAPTEIPGSALEPKVEVRDAEGTFILEKTGIGATGPAVYFDGYETTWDVRVSDVNGEGSGEHWTVLYLRTRAEGYGNPREVEPNDTAVDATAIEQSPNTSNGVTSDRGFLQGVLATPGDVDHYEFNVVQRGGLRLVCSSSSFGSTGDVEVELYDGSGTSLGVFSDGDDSAPDITLTDLDEGLYTLRFFEKEGGGAPSVYYRCGVYADRP